MAKMIFSIIIIAAFIYVGFNASLNVNVIKNTHRTQIEASLDFK